jgi:hypothetical protein
MPAENRAEIEAEIGKLLLEQWDPNGIRNGADAAPYAPYAHELYGLLARGASDSQVGRRLHQAESDELNHPELAQRDLSTLLRALRAIEKRI